MCNFLTSNIDYIQAVLLCRFRHVRNFQYIDFNSGSISGNEQTQTSTAQNPDEIALDDDDDEDEDDDEDNDEEEGEEEGEEGEGEREDDGIVKQCVPDEVFGKLAETVHQDEEAIE